MSFLRSRIFSLAAVLLAGMLLVIVGRAEAQPPGGPGGPDSPDLLLLEKYDADKDGVLNKTERVEARKEVKRLAAAGQDRRRPRRPGGGRRGGQTGKAGPAVKPENVTNYPDAGLFDPNVLRTLFIEFESDDWEEEMADFKPTDVEIPATMMVDGNTYENVGMSFRGASSFFMIQPGLKRSLNISMDFMNPDQRLYGYKSLNLLNGNGDPSLMSSILYSTISRQKIAAPKVNFVKVVINGRSWGVYVSAQQFNKTFLKENYESEKGTRWKVNGSPRGDGGLRYLGDDVAEYRERFEIKSKDNDEAWQQLIELCRVLDETPADKLESELSQRMDVDGLLWFLAVDVSLVNSDGYWTRASDYSIYLDEGGKFHILPHDMNEAFCQSGGGPGGGPGGRGGGPPRGGPPGGGRFGPPGGGPPRGGPPGGGGPGGGGPGHGDVDLDPLVGLDNDRFPLRSKVLAVPELRTRYLEYVRDIAMQLKDWKGGLGRQVAQYRELIEDEVKNDTRKLMANNAFNKATRYQPVSASGSLQDFAKKRSTYLLKQRAVKALSVDD